MPPDTPPIDDSPTAVVPAVPSATQAATPAARAGKRRHDQQSGSPATRGRRRWAWFVSLRARLTLTYVAVLVVVLLILGIVLNLVVGQVLYAGEQATFVRDARAAVARQLIKLDALVNGNTGSGTSQTASSCAAAVSYQQAFTETIANPLSDRSDIQQVYLLNAIGTVLAPVDNAQVTAGRPGPYLRDSALAALVQAASARPHATAVVLGDANYRLSDGGQPRGVELIAMRYPAAATACTGAVTTTIGIVEVVSDFATAQAVLARLRFILLLVVAAAALGGILIGGALTARALSPLARMTHAARRIARGDLSQRVRLAHTNDEIGELATTFDEMADRIEAAFAAQAESDAHMRQFVADASHELRTPLTAIRGYTDVLLRGAARDDPATAEKVLQATRREAERMSRLVNDLLTLARLDTGRPLELQAVDVVALAGEAVDQARILAGQREVSLTTDGGGRLMLPADPDRLKQVLLILLDNALKYGRPEPEGWVRVRVSRTERGALITITDNGQGIAPDDLPHVFDRFYRGERAARQRQPTGQQVAARLGEPPVPYERATRPGISGTGTGRGAGGSGLGLAIAQSIVRAHGGTLEAESRLGVGTTFTIALPRPPSNPPTRPPDAPRGRADRPTHL
jgi:two-component system OmpR family sensor kinase